MTQVKLISGECIVGKITQENNLYIYILTKPLVFTEQDIQIFGKEYCDYMSGQQNIIKIPKDEIISID
jgi:hypothetical protein